MKKLLQNFMHIANSTRFFKKNGLHVILPPQEVYIEHNLSHFGCLKLIIMGKKITVFLS